MRSVMSRLVCFLLAAVLLSVCIQEVSIPVKAAYENTYVNTGDQRADLIGVALTQVGYREGANNYTKYGQWYGASNTAWCGMFISWCANQAGIPTSVLKKNGFASASGFGIPSYYATQKTPRPGDLFFKTSGGHTGIVYYVEGDYFYTLEGNTDEYSNDGVGVFIRKRNLYGNYYFGEPPYQSDVGHNYVKGVETNHPHKEYYACTDCDNMYYTGTNGTVDTCQECIMASCSHQYGNWETVDGSYHKGVCSLCTKEDVFEHDWDSGQILQAPTCEDTGLERQSCTKCGTSREVELPSTNDHRYGEWIYVDNEYHYRVCADCGRERTERHTKAGWSKDLFEHWYDCADCGGRAGMEAHDFGGNCESACKTCDYTMPGGHLFGSEWIWNNSGHWLECENCSANKSYETHVFSAECDESCNICGYTRQMEHSYGENWECSEKGHWHACEACGQVQELIPHIPGSAATEEHGQDCTVCGYELMEARTHVHSFTYKYSDNTHWGTCHCGEKAEQQGHVWDLGTGKCKTCQAALPEIQSEQIPWIIILPAVAVVAAVTAVVISIVLLRKKKKKAKEKELLEV